MNIGFTGTRNGMTRGQLNKFIAMIEEMECSTFHHGACDGADEEACDFVRNVFDDTVKIIAHPGMSAKDGTSPFTSKRALAISDEVRPTKPYFKRNIDIVENSRVMFAAPRSMKQRAGGTWMTINYASNSSSPAGPSLTDILHVISPDGDVFTTRCGSPVAAHDLNHGSEAKP